MVGEGYRLAVVALGIASALLLSGCGGHAAGVAASSAQTSCDPLLSAIGNSGNGGMEAGYGEDNNALKHVSAFARPRRASDVVPASARDVAPTSNPYDTGDVYLSRSRLLLGDGGDGSVYAIPVEAEDQTCLLVNHGARSYSGCATGYDYEYEPLREPGKCAGGTLEVVGMVPNGVVRVELFLNRRRHDVRVVNNAFLYLSGSSNDALNALVLVYRSGKRMLSYYGTGWRPPNKLISRAP